MTDMVERVKEWVNRNLWNIDGKEMQKEVIDSRNIILALVEVAENLQAQYYISCPACDDNLKYSTLTTCEARIAEVLGEKGFNLVVNNDMPEGEARLRSGDSESKIVNIGEKESCSICGGSKIVPALERDTAGQRVPHGEAGFDPCPDCEVKDD